MPAVRSWLTRIPLTMCIKNMQSQVFSKTVNKIAARRSSSIYKRSMCQCSIHVPTEVYSWYSLSPVVNLNSVFHKCYGKCLHFEAKAATCDKTKCDFIQTRKVGYIGRSSYIEYSDSNPGLAIKNSSESDSDQEDVIFNAALDAVTPNTEPPLYVNIVPGKGPPPEPPIDCCMSGCANCVWIQYCEELKHYFVDGAGESKAKEAIESIENPGLKMFLKLELGFQ